MAKGGTGKSVPAKPAPRAAASKAAPPAKKAAPVPARTPAPAAPVARSAAPAPGKKSAPAPAPAAKKSAPAPAPAAKKAPAPAPAKKSAATPAAPPTKDVPVAAPPKKAAPAAPAKAGPAPKVAAPSKPAPPAKPAPAKAVVAPAKAAPVAKAAAPAPKAAPAPTPAAAKAAPAAPAAPRPVAPMAKKSAPVPSRPAFRPGPAEPLGGPLEAKFLQAQKELLLDERAQLLGQAESLEHEAAALMEDLDPGDVQFDDESGEGDTMVVERERDLALSAQARQLVVEIDAALLRIDAGTYGYSLLSGKAIPRDRLKAIPWAVELVEEKVGGLGRR